MSKSKVDVSFAELHGALFLGGKNFGLKLDPHRHAGLGLIYDQDLQELLVSYQDKVAHVPSSNVVSWTEGKVEDRKITQMGHPIVSGISGAQVETPMGHVHAGPGYGKTGKVKL